MNGKEGRIIDRIEKLIRLSGSSNEHEARSAMVKAQELMAKYEIDREKLEGNEGAERQVVGFTSASFRDDWVSMVANVIADNFRCRCITIQKLGSGGAFRLRFYGFEEDAEIAISIFRYAVKVVRQRFATLRAIYAEAGRDFGRSEKMNYVLGFCKGLERNFEEQKRQSRQYALALVVPEEVNRFIETNMPDIETTEYRDFEVNREHTLLHSAGYADGRAFKNAGDKERLEDGS